MFCPMSSCYKNATETRLEEFQNCNNWRKIAGDSPVRKRFLASKIHKLKKILKFGSNALAKRRTLEELQNNENEVEHRQNLANEALEHKLVEFRQQQHCQYLEEEQNMVNENWENWDGCYLCAGQQHSYYPPSYCTSSTNAYFSIPPSEHSICYVFMPDQPEPVPVKLRNAKIPGGVMWISYQPDLDIRAGDNLHAYTSSQIPQGQRAVLV